MQLSKLRSQAIQAYNQGQYQDAIKLYSQIISQNPQAKDYWNRACVYNFIAQYPLSIDDCNKSIELGFKTEAVYMMLVKTYLIQDKLNEAQSISKQGLKLFPQNVKLKQVSKDINEKQQVSNQSQYIQKVFTKFCSHPVVSTYLKDQSYLTKLEILVRNPRMVDTLSKLDPRVRQAYDVLLEAQEPPK